MTSRTAGRLAWGIAFLCFGMVAASLVLLYLNRSAIVGDISGTADISDFIGAVTIGVLGALIASRRPQNPIGWLLLAGAAVSGVSVLTLHVAMRALLSGVSPHGWPRWPALIHNAIGGLGLGAVVFFFLLFPNGRPLTRRWRWVIRFGVVAVAAATTGNFLDPTTVQLSTRLPSLGNPIGLRAFAGFSNNFPSFLGFLAILILAVVSLVLRFRRARGEERQQLKWFAYAVILSVSLLVVAVLLSLVNQTLSNVAWYGALIFGFDIAIPGAAVLAILKYGLYEIDVVINKTLVYFSLAAFITVMYVGIVVGIGAVINARGSVGLSILATAIVAVAFQPIREWSRRFANRLVYGKRATPYEVLSEFAERVAGTYATDDVLPRMATILAEATGAVRADVWLRVGQELHIAGSWPSDPSNDRIPLADPDSPEVPGATRLAAVRHQGETLGVLSIQKGPGDPISPAEDKLLADVAGQAGLVLRNVGLIEELRASRQRLVTAQDEERRRLERNIHDGAQQQLIALAVKANLTEQLMGRDDERARSLVAQLKAEATEALENLRDLARGIYPPLLADQGLVAALTAQARKSPLAVSVEAEGIGRFSQDAEAAVYFCTLEALQNVSKYAQAGRATVNLRHDDHHLAFEVTDDGVGFDPKTKGYGTGMQGMADRLAALGGELTVTSSPGAGTTVRGRVPVASPDPYHFATHIQAPR